MDENTLTWAQSIQAEAERLTLKRIKEDQDERDRLKAEEQRLAPQADNKKKA